GRDDRALDHEHVEPGLERDLVVVAHLLRCQRARREDAGALDLLDPLRDQLRLDRPRVDLLHSACRLLLRQLRDLRQLLLRLRVAREDALEVEHPEAAELAELDRSLRRDDAVHRRGKQRQLEQVWPELPADVDVLRVACPPRGHDRDVVEPVRLPSLLAPPDLDLHPGYLPLNQTRPGVWIARAKKSLPPLALKWTASVAPPPDATQRRRRYGTQKTFGQCRPRTRSF